MSLMAHLLILVYTVNHHESLLVDEGEANDVLRLVHWQEPFLPQRARDTQKTIFKFLKRYKDPGCFVLCPFLSPMSLVQAILIS